MYFEQQGLDDLISHFKGNISERKSHTAVYWDWNILYILQSFPTFYFFSRLFCHNFIRLSCLICSKMIGMTRHYYSFTDRLTDWLTDLRLFWTLGSSIYCSKYFSLTIHCDISPRWSLSIVQRGQWPLSIQPFTSNTH